MAKLIKSRSKAQIKSHHQKMMVHYKSIKGIILGLYEKKNIKIGTTFPDFVEEMKK